MVQVRGAVQTVNESTHCPSLLSTSNSPVKLSMASAACRAGGWRWRTHTRPLWAFLTGSARGRFSLSMMDTLALRWLATVVNTYWSTSPATQTSEVEARVEGAKTPVLVVLNAQWKVGRMVFAQASCRLMSTCVPFRNASTVLTAVARQQWALWSHQSTFTL